MNSPVNQLLKQLIAFDKSSAQALYIQASQQVINAIQRGYLEKGSRLPGTRVFAELLGVHRKTAVAIYDELASQGWVNIVPNKGTYVIIPDEDASKIKVSGQTINQAYAYSEDSGFPFQQSFNLASTETNSTSKYIINAGKPDLRLHPTHQFSRWYTAAMKRKSLVSKWNTTQETTSSIFKTQLCNYLNATRGFRISSKNIVNTRSADMNLYIVSQLLIAPKDVVLVGQLSNYASNMIFQQAGADIKTIPVDAEGLDVDYIKTHFIKNSIRCVYVNANRNYPTTVSLSAKRRLQLLQLAKDYGFAIIEDDYDYDFQFTGSAMLPMATADARGMVIYLGKLGQSLFPSFHTGFIVAPNNFIAEANNYLQLLDKQGDLIQEQMLAELISEGEIYRFKKKNNIIYKKRRDCAVHFLEHYFKGILSWKVPSGGLAIWLNFEDSISLIKLSEEAENLDLFIPKTILYQDKTICAIRFGFGHLNESEIETVIQKLKQAYVSLLDS